MRGASSILRGWFTLQQSGRDEFHFVEWPFNTRQQQYLRDPPGRKGVWTLVDERIAARLGSRFRLLPNDVVVTTGHAGRIDKQCILSVWENDHTMLEMDGLLKETPELIVQKSENVYPSPCHRDRRCVDTTYAPLSIEGSSSPDKRKRPRSVSPKEYRPRSPKPSELGAPGNQRPASWYAVDEPIGKLSDVPSRAHKQMRIEGFPPRVLYTAPAPVQEKSHVSKPPAPKMRHDVHPFDMPPSTRPPLASTMPVIAKFTPIPENFSVCDIQRIIQETVQDEVERRMHILRSSMHTPPEVPVPESAFSSISSNMLFSHPALHARSSSSHQVHRDGMLNLAPLGSPSIHPVRRASQPYDAPRGSRISPYGLKPRNPSIPYRTPRVPEASQQEDDEEEEIYAPRTLEECMMDAYNFKLDFRKRGIPPFPQRLGRRLPMR